MVHGKQSNHAARSSPDSFSFPLLINHPAIATYLLTTALEVCNSFAQAPHYHIPRLLTWGLKLWPGTWPIRSRRMRTQTDKCDEANSRLLRLQECTLKCKQCLKSSLNIPLLSLNHSCMCFLQQWLGWNIGVWYSHCTPGTALERPMPRIQKSCVAVEVVKFPLGWAGAEGQVFGM